MNKHNKKLALMAWLLLTTTALAQTPATTSTTNTTTTTTAAPSKWDMVLRLASDGEVVYKQAHNGIIAAISTALELRLRGKKDYPPAMLGTLPDSLRAEALDLALIADAVYLNETADVGVTTVYSYVEELIDEKSGFKARVYKNAAAKKMIIAFEGTTGNLNSPKWLTNYESFLGSEPAQYKKAVEYVQTTQNKFEKEKFEILLVGHSLGGGLATYAALSTGLKATTFNAAGVGNAMLDVLEKNETTKGRLKSAKDFITNIDCRYDPISLMGGQLGQSYIIETPVPKITTVPTTTKEAAEYVYNNLLAPHFCSTVITTLKAPAK